MVRTPKKLFTAKFHRIENGKLRFSNKEWILIGNLILLRPEVVDKIEPRWKISTEAPGKGRRKVQKKTPPVNSEQTSGPIPAKRCVGDNSIVRFATYTVC